MTDLAPTPSTQETDPGDQLDHIMCCREDVDLTLCGRSGEGLVETTTLEDFTNPCAVCMNLFHYSFGYCPKYSRCVDP